jgi:hypothetical protein
LRLSFRTLLPAILISMLTAGCPSPFTYGITKSTLDAGTRKESVKDFLTASKTKRTLILNYSVIVSVPGERDGETKPRWAVWEIEDLKTNDLPLVSVRSSPIDMNGDILSIVSMNSTQIRSLEDYQRERLAAVDEKHLYWIGNGKTKQLSGLDQKEYRLFWGYLAQAILPLALVADVITYPFQVLGGIMECTMSASGMYRDPRCD